MPQRVKREKKIEWTEKFDSGMSIAEIRHQETPLPDSRTVQKAIDEVHGTRRRQAAKEVALREGLKEHWRLLLNALDQLPAREFDWTDFDKEPVYHLNARVFRGDGWVAQSRSGDWDVELAIEASIEYELLREHLPADRFWSLLTAFKRDLLDVLMARLLFAKAVVEAVKKSTGLEVVEDGEQRGLNPAGLSNFDQQLTARALRDKKQLLDIREESGSVWIGDSLLLTGRASEMPPFAELIEQAVTDIKGSDNWRTLLAASGKVNQTFKKLTREAAVLKLSTVLPGECGSCARFSI